MSNNYDASYVDTDVDDGKTYTYRVALRDTDTPAMTAYQTSESLMYTEYEGSLILNLLDKSDTWIFVHLSDQTTPSGATVSYDLKYSAPGVPEQVASFTPTNKKLENLNPNTEYKIVGVAYNVDNTPIYSDPIYVKTNRAKPDHAVSFKGINICPEKVTVQAQYADPSQFDTWEMYMNNSFVGSGFSDKIEQKVQGLVPGGTYTFKIIVTNETGSTSDEVVVHTTRYQGPTASGLMVLDQTITNDGGTVSWVNDPEDWNCNDKIRDVILISRVFVRQDGTVDSSVVYAEHKDITNYVVTGAGEKTWVGVYVKPFNEHHVLGDWTGPVWFRTYGPPDAPTDLKAVSRVDATGDNETLVTWMDPIDDNSPEDMYVIEVSINGGDFKFLSNIRKDAESFIHKPVQEGVTYTYRITGINQYGNGPYSEELEHMLDFSTAPNAPYNLQAMMADSGVRLSWLDDSDRESGFAVMRSMDGSSWDEIGTTAMNVTWFLDETATSGQTYWYQVVARNDVGDSGPSETVEFTYGATTAFVNVYPNPTVDGVNVRVASSASHTAQVSLIDQSNRKVIETSIKLDNGVGRLPLNGVVPGAYQLIIKTDGQQVSRKIYKY
ncbi:T9SS type A sorting domain-containing protein [Marinilongibacter aquaticus]|uniref:fibronectin type III domain-containing protein n=1 Tax=Marinilongibacter aquaticus TaxID=2975157 RepID=UPI0021BCFEB1|nr:T9SS type A sorting domain-containing protein [Marinilongibacter aquaticus]UBM58426.1 T9SS type A sorting domain-containing protein [Marinilongibacter aquaticus]